MLIINKIAIEWDIRSISCFELVIYRNPSWMFCINFYCILKIRGLNNKWAILWEHWRCNQKYWEPTHQVLSILPAIMNPNNRIARKMPQNILQYLTQLHSVVFSSGGKVINRIYRFNSRIMGRLMYLLWKRIYMDEKHFAEIWIGGEIWYLVGTMKKRFRNTSWFYAEKSRLWKNHVYFLILH